MANSKIITYDLCNANKNYEDLYEYIKGFSSYEAITESTWIVSSDKDSKTIRDELSSILDPDDRYFVGKLTGQAAWHNVLCKNEDLKAIL